jgi:DNA repair protein RecN (Recombination protein N)
MLQSLHIENIAVIKNIDLDFSDGFMVISGETGAGKSIIIDSINLILGAKADKELIRHGESVATVSASFSIRTKSALFSFMPSPPSCVSLQDIFQTRRGVFHRQKSSP